jgi:hypothetical protein
MNKLRVSKGVLSDSCRNALDPNLFVFPTLSFAIPVRVLPALLDPTDGNRIAILGSPMEALGKLEQSLVLWGVKGQQTEQYCDETDSLHCITLHYSQSVSQSVGQLVNG